MILFPATLAAHVFGIIFWIGGVASAAVLLRMQSEQPEHAKDLSSLAVTLFRTVAMPGMLLAILTGVALIVQRPAVFKEGGWFHLKLTLAVLAVALHHILLAKARRRAESDAELGVPAVAGLAGGVLAAAAAAVALVFTRPF